MILTAAATATTLIGLVGLGVVSGAIGRRSQPAPIPVPVRYRRRRRPER